MKFSSLFFILLTLFFQVCANDTATSAIHNAMLFGRYHGALMGSVVSSSCQFTLLGNEDACCEIQEMIFNLKKEMNITRDVQVKKMNERAFNLFGYGNAFATHNALFVDEQWILNLDYESRRCLLAHELSHIKNWDVARQYILHTMFVIVSFSLGSVLSTALIIFLASLVMTFHKRYSEKLADYRAATVVGKETMQEFLKDSLIDETHDGLMGWFSSFFSSYPTQKERIDYLSKDNKLSACH